MRQKYEETKGKTKKQRVKTEGKPDTNHPKYTRKERDERKMKMKLPWIE